MNTGEHREMQADVERQDWETPPHKPGPPAGLREGLARAQKAEGPSVAHEDRTRPSGEDGRSRHRPGGPPPSGRGARAPPEVKSQKLPQMWAVCGTLHDRCTGPRRARWRGALDNLPVSIQTQLYYMLCTAFRRKIAHHY